MSLIDGEALTALEHDVIERLGVIYNDLCQIVADGPSREGDLAEAVFHVHGLQRMVGSQAAARFYPERFRLLGSSLHVSPECDDGA